VEKVEKNKVIFFQTEDRKQGVKTMLKVLKGNPIKGKRVLIKPNFNTADPTPGSTHNDVLVSLVEELWKMGAKSVSVGDRSFPPTREVMEKKGILPLMEKLDVKIAPFDDLPEKDWVEFRPKDSHWPDGFRIARPVLESLSLKLHVGGVQTSRQGYEYMRQLHSSPHQRKMIAEINEPFKPNLVIMDGIEAFVDGGPATGKGARGNVFWASSDRIAVDAVGVALLKHLGSNERIMNRKIFEQTQIARAVELGLGVSSPAQIELAAADAKSRAYRDKVAEILNQG